MEVVEMSKEKGYISLFRDIKDHWLWEDKPFSRGQAFIDLIIRASYKNKKISFNGKIIELERGEFITSILKLSENWGWSRWKVKAFLDLLVDDNMITYKTDNKKTTIKVLKYDVYQDLENTKPTTKRQQNNIKPTQSIKENKYTSLSKEREVVAEKKVNGDPKGYTDF